jgi:SAM-dependent methyltransferase
MSRAFRRAVAAGPRPIPSPNIWNWPEVYEAENRAQDAEGAIWAALHAAVPWEGHDVVDVGCGDGFHLPLFTGAASVTGVEPHAPLVVRARARLAGHPGIRVLEAGAAALPLPDASVDLVHARTAYFFGPGCEPGFAEADRVLRPGGTLAITFSNRCFPTKAVRGWLLTDDEQHGLVVSELVRRTGLFHEPQVELRTRPGVGDPLYAVTATRL